MVPVSSSSSSGGNNPLNLFPSTITPQQAQAKVQRLTYTTFNRAPTHIQTMLASTLYDDTLEYMTTLDMNRAASYTFGYRNAIDIHGMANSSGGGGGECIAEEMWQLVLNCTLQVCTQHSILALTKTLHLLQHVLLHGSEVCVMDGQLLYRIEMIVEPLRHLNTALVEQRMLEQILNSNNHETQGGSSSSTATITTTTTTNNNDSIVHQLSQLGSLATATIMKLRGGSVDKGHPVRTAACKLYDTVHTPNVLRQLRYQQQQQPSSSLVPIGSNKKVGYITDDARYRMLQEKVHKEETVLQQKKMKEKQQYQITKSNLAGHSATNSFGGGYTSGGGGGGGGSSSTTGSTVVVGAAHSLSDMIASAKYEIEQHKLQYNTKILTLQQSYADDPYTRSQQIAKLEAEQTKSNPEFVKKEKALQDALEYLEEMQQLEEQQQEKQQQQVILEDDLLGVGNSSTITTNNISSNNNKGGINDLLGFHDTTINNNDNNFTTLALGIQGHSGGNVVANNNADLLGFDNLSDGYNVNNNSSSSSIGIYDGNINNSNIGGYYPAGGATTTTALSSMSSTTFNRGLNSTNTYTHHKDEETDVAEQLRKVNLAEGLFAGVSGSWCDPNFNSNKRNNISDVYDNNSAISTEIADTPFYLNPSAIVSNNVGMYDMNADTYSICDIGNPMGGSSSFIHDNFLSMVPPPSMPPPPPPSMPPPPPSPATTVGLDGVLNNNPMGNCLSVEQMQEMIRQQQEQMNQMITMMQQMQGNNMPPS
jgi:uncharacterized membrane protein YgcG